MAAELKKVFLAFCQFGDKTNKGTMDTRTWKKVCVDCGLIANGYTSPDVDLTYTRCRDKTTKKLGFADFVKALEEVATKQKAEKTDIVAKVVAQGGPKSAGTVASATRLHDDKSTWTGAATKGGPTVDDKKITQSTLLDRSAADVRGVKHADKHGSGMSFEEKLVNLRPDADSIRAVAEWALFFKKFEEVPASWLSVFLREMRPDRLLTLLYLSNDLLQRCTRSEHRDCAAYIPAFASALRPALEHFAIITPADAAPFKAASRLLGIWKKRGTFASPSVVEGLALAMGVNYGTLTDAKEAPAAGGAAAAGRGKAPAPAPVPAPVPAPAPAPTADADSAAVAVGDIGDLLNSDWLANLSSIIPTTLPIQSAGATDAAPAAAGSSTSSLASLAAAYSAAASALTDALTAAAAAAAAAASDASSNPAAAAAAAAAEAGKSAVETASRLVAEAVTAAETAAEGGALKPSNDETPPLMPAQSPSALVDDVEGGIGEPAAKRARMATGEATS